MIAGYVYSWLDHLQISLNVQFLSSLPGLAVAETEAAAVTTAPMTGASYSDGVEVCWLTSIIIQNATVKSFPTFGADFDQNACK